MRVARWKIKGDSYILFGVVDGFLELRHQNFEHSETIPVRRQSRVRLCIEQMAEHPGLHLRILENAAFQPSQLGGFDELEVLAAEGGQSRPRILLDHGSLVL